MTLTKKIAFWVAHTVLFIVAISALFRPDLKHQIIGAVIIVTVALVDAGLRMIIGSQRFSELYPWTSSK